MVEIWLAKGSQGFVRFGHKMWRRIARIPAGARVAILVAALVAGQMLWQGVHRPRHLDALADEWGNLSYMLENEKPQVSHDGTRILYCDSAEDGVGVFVASVGTGKTKRIFEEKEIHFGMGPHGVLAPFPWSPNDRWLVYARQGPGALDEERALPNETALTLCRASNDKPTQTLISPFGRVVALVWLDSNTFMYASGTEGEVFMVVRKQADGHWTQSSLKRPAVQRGKLDKHFCALAALSDHTIAWLQANRLWTLDVRSNTATKLFTFPTNEFFTSFDYCKRTRQFLLSSVGSKADSLWRMPLDAPVQLTRIVTDSHTHNNSWNDAIWVGNGPGWAYIRPPGLDLSGLVLKPGPSAHQTLLFKNAYVQYVVPAPDGRHLFVAGNLHNRPGSAIWEYDTADGSQHCIVPAAPGSMPYLKPIRASYVNVRISAHEHLNVEVFPPANYNRRSDRKYPVVITSIRYVRADPYLTQYGEAIANAGAYFILIDHPWSQRSLNHWASRIFDVYHYLVQLPTIDPHRVFLMSNSAQSTGLMMLLKQHPGLWKGAIFLAPGGNLTKPSQLASAGGHLARLLVTAESHYPSAHYLSQYQQEACGAGIEMNYVIHPHTPHEFIAKGSQRARLRAMLHFIFGP